MGQKRLQRRKARHHKLRYLSTSLCVVRAAERGGCVWHKTSPHISAACWLSSSFCPCAGIALPHFRGAPVHAHALCEQRGALRAARACPLPSAHLLPRSSAHPANPTHGTHLTASAPSTRSSFCSMADQSLPDTIEKANDESMYYDGMKQDEGIWKPPQKMSKVFCRPHACPPFTCTCSHGHGFPPHKFESTSLFVLGSHPRFART